ncbi:RnfH family protein [Legionella sp.]|uniref:RnfH family protein n=1 Tax=Legionella sp. TaxID=459 RepID=UPI003220983D
MVKVELVYIAADQSLVQIPLVVDNGATVADALTQSGILSTHPEVKELPLGIFSKQVSLDTVLKSGDRIEIYRELTLDPKERRRQRAKNSAR